MPTLHLNKKITEMSSDERHEFYAVTANILQLAQASVEMDREKGRKTDADVHRALVAAIYLKSYGRSALNIRLEYDVDPVAFVFDAGNHVMAWTDRLKEAVEHSPPEAPHRAFLMHQAHGLDSWKRIYGSIFIDARYRADVRDFMEGWIEHLAEVEAKE